VSPKTYPQTAASQVGYTFNIKYIIIDCIILHYIMHILHKITVHGGFDQILEDTITRGFRTPGGR